MVNNLLVMSTFQQTIAGISGNFYKTGPEIFPQKESEAFEAKRQNRRV